MKGEFSNIISFTHYHILLEKNLRNKNSFLRTIKMGYVDIISSFAIHSECLKCAIFHRYHPGLLQYNITFSSFVLKPDNLERAFQRRNLLIFSYFAPWGIYNYRVIKQSVNQGYLGISWDRIYSCRRKNILILLIFKNLLDALFRTKMSTLTQVAIIENSTNLTGLTLIRLLCRL